MLYPIVFVPIYKKMVWGYESWDISCRVHEMSLVENGSLAGMRFEDVIKKNPPLMLGTKTDVFPLLVKIIGADDDLSIQVHPDDGYAAAHGFESGKNEMWCIIETPGRLIIGLKDGTTPQMLKHEPMACLNMLPVAPGDFISIEAGLVHAIVGGTVLAEIQQNSDVTFRIFDYGRKGIDGKPRQLHLDHAIAVTDFAGRIKKDVCQEVSTPFFNVRKLRVAGWHQGETTPESFVILTCVDGEVEINGVSLANRRSAFLPAGLGRYFVNGDAVLLVTTL